VGIRAKSANRFSNAIATSGAKVIRAKREPNPNRNAKLN
jgi:hypothetical protein